MRGDALAVSALLLLLGAALQMRLWMLPIWAVVLPAQTPAPAPPAAGAFPAAAPSAPPPQSSATALRPAMMRYSRVRVPRGRLRAALRAGSLDLTRLAADGGSIGDIQGAIEISHWPREDDCAALCRLEARRTETGLLGNTSRSTVNRACLAYIWHAAPFSEGGGKCFLVGAKGSRGPSRAKRRPLPTSVPSAPLMPDAPLPPMTPCAKLLASTNISTSSASNPAHRFVLVTSAARVGSNWVRSLLNQHPQLHMEGERLDSFVHLYSRSPCP